MAPYENQMKLSKVVIWSALPLTILGLLASVMTMAAGAGHGDKSLIVFIFPLPAFSVELWGAAMGFVFACLQFPLYSLAIYAASKRGWEWRVTGAVLLTHFGVVFWILRSMR
jgi:hypothetical protein